MIYFVIILVFGIAIAYTIGQTNGYMAGWKDGDQSGKLDQHLYQQNVNRKRRFK